MGTVPHPISDPRSLEGILLEVLPDDERRLLRSGAVLRYITRELAELATGSVEKAQALVNHPFVQKGGGGRQGEIWTMPEPLRRELVRGRESDAAKTWELIAMSDDKLEAMYAMLAVDRTRSEGLRRLEAAFDHAISSRSIGEAHDLLRLLDEWPVDEHPEARAMRDRLSPRLRRHSRALRDCEASDKYFERDFEQDLMDLILRHGSHWILHLHAPGGRGKTMFLENLLGRTCPARDISVAWIDFDHIDRLGVNTTQPWRLLLTIAHQLDPQLPHSPFAFMLDSYGHLRAGMYAETLPRHGSTRALEDTSIGDEIVAQAAEEVPRKFRAELAAALGNDIVVIAVDTVENVQHADGADIDPVLAALAEVRHGGEAKSDHGVPGLRVIVSGRYDLESDRVRLDGSLEPRSVQFHDRLLGPEIEVRHQKDTELRIGRQAISVELPPFSDDEARRFLARSLTDNDVVDAIVRRSDGNPMKLALFAEYVTQKSTTTALEIDSLQSVELAYLVTRVVDRIANGLVQWLLRWGALMKVLTKGAVDQIIWPALEELVERGSNYDDATTGKTPHPGRGVARWELPSAADVRRPGSADMAWDELLRYATRSSWVSTLEDIPNAVHFHPEVRDPLRNLLRDEGNPVFDDIHRRAFKYWETAAPNVSGRARSEALRSMVFHAYEASGGPAYGDGVWTSLLTDYGESRIDRAELADELLAVAERLAESGRPPPSSDVVGLARLERAEALVHEATTTGRPVDESALSTHRQGITETVRTREPRRTRFLDAVMDVALERIDEAWMHLDSALRHPAPANDQQLASLTLIVEWAQSLTPPRNALDTARLLRAAAVGTPLAPLASRPLARGLRATEQWTDALEVAQGAESAELVAEALLALGRADEVLSNRSNPAEARAKAALLNLDGVRALLELDTAPTATASPVPDPSASLVRGRAHVLRRENQQARAALSYAASGRDPVVAVEANLLLSRLMWVTGDRDLSISSLNRNLRGTEVANIRATALDAIVNRKVDADFSANAVRDAYEAAARVEWIQPSIRVELECARLCVLGATVSLLNDLAEALSMVDGAPARLQALQWLAEVPAADVSIPPSLASRLLSLTDVVIAAGTPALLLIRRAELERVLGNARRARQVLDVVADIETSDPTSLRLSLEDARHRLSDDATGWRSFDVYADKGKDRDAGVMEWEHELVVVQISSAKGGSILFVETNLDASDPAAVTGKIEISDDALIDGPFSIAAEPDAVFEALGAGLAVGNVNQRLEQTTSPVLDLQIHDDAAARWPWELARRGDRPLQSILHDGAVVRTGRRASLRSPEDRVPCPEVEIAVLNERKDRGHVAGLLADLYGQSAQVVFGEPRDLIAGKLTRTGLPRHLLHLVADPIERRKAPALQLSGGDHVTPERLTTAIDQREPTLLILDLVLQETDTAAAEQLMLANAFCWHAVRNAHDLSVLCGIFGGANDRLGHLRLLVDGLREGAPLADLVGKLQRHQATLPGGRHPLRDCVSLSTDVFHRRFQLGNS